MFEGHPFAITFSGKKETYSQSHGRTAAAVRRCHMRESALQLIGDYVTCSYISNWQLPRVSFPCKEIGILLFCFGTFPFVKRSLSSFFAQKTLETTFGKGLLTLGLRSKQNVSRDMWIAISSALNCAIHASSSNATHESSKRGKAQILTARALLSIHMVRFHLRTGGRPHPNEPPFLHRCVFPSKRDTLLNNLKFWKAQTNAHAWHAWHSKTGWLSNLGSTLTFSGLTENPSSLAKGSQVLTSLGQMHQRNCGWEGKQHVKALSPGPAASCCPRSSRSRRLFSGLARKPLGGAAVRRCDILRVDPPAPLGRASQKRGAVCIRVDPPEFQPFVGPPKKGRVQ